MKIQIGRLSITHRPIFMGLAVIMAIAILGQIYLKFSNKSDINYETIILSVILLITCVYFSVK
jgi:hypothetical protein